MAQYKVIKMKKNIWDTFFFLFWKNINFIVTKIKKLILDLNMTSFDFDNSAIPIYN
jgi:hypothetical protein